MPPRREDVRAACHGSVSGAGVWRRETRSVAGGPQLPFDPFAKDLKRQVDAPAAAAATVATVHLINVFENRKLGRKGLQSREYIAARVLQTLSYRVGSAGPILVST